MEVLDFKLENDLEINFGSVPTRTQFWVTLFRLINQTLMRIAKVCF